MAGTPYDGLFIAAGSKYGVPVEILEAVAWTESSMNPAADAGGRDGVGLMQVTHSTAAGLGYSGTREGLKIPAVNVDLGAKYISQIIGRQGGIHLANLYSEYNSGRASLWRTSSQVAEHVSNFLDNFARVVGVALPADLSIESALRVLGDISEEQTSGPALLALLGLVFWFWKGR